VPLGERVHLAHFISVAKEGKGNGGSKLGIKKSSWGSGWNKNKPVSKLKRVPEKSCLIILLAGFIQTSVGQKWSEPCSKFR
jgi:hypothetical protein